MSRETNRKSRAGDKPQNGRQIIYEANFDAFNELLGYLVEDCCGGNPELCLPSAATVVSNRKILA